MAENISEIEAQFITAMQEHLTQLHIPLVEKLCEVLSAARPYGTETLWFEYFSDSFYCEALPLVVTAVAKNETWLDWPPFAEGFLLGGSGPQGLPDDWDYTTNFDVYTLSSKLTGEAFRSAWEKANSEGLLIPAYFAQHDDIERLNLRTGEWEASP